MNSEWLTYLQTQGAQTGPDGSLIFPNAAANTECMLFDLSHLGLIAVSGEDTESFLQGQLTNDVRELTEEHSQLSSHCSAKGRMLANFRLFRRDDNVYLQMPRENLASMIKRFTMFKLRAKVEIRDAGEELVRIGLAGDCATTLLRNDSATAPELENTMQRRGEVSIIRMPGHAPRFEIIGPPAAIEALWTELSAKATPCNADAWALLDIRAGQPTVYGTTVEAFVPQMANMQLVDGVSFTKGCYTGQEVVARMQYLGKLKRRMYLAEVDSDVAPQAGDLLVSDSSASGQGAGKIVDARASANGRYELLAVVEVAAVEQGQVQWGENGPVLKFLDLPYSLPEIEAAVS